jgi:hypothetical protein
LAYGQSACGTYDDIFLAYDYGIAAADLETDSDGYAKIDPVINSFSTSAASATNGSSVTLSWDTDFGTTLQLLKYVGGLLTNTETVTGQVSKSVTISETVSYKLRATNVYGSVDSESVEITLSNGGNEMAQMLSSQVVLPIEVLGAVQVDAGGALIATAALSASDVASEYSAGTHLNADLSMFSAGGVKNVITALNTLGGAVDAAGISNITIDDFYSHDGSGAITIDASAFTASVGLALDADAAGVRQHLSVTDNGGDGSLSYDAATGVISYTGPSASEVRAHLSVTDNGGDGSLSYDNSTGVISFTGPSASEVRAHLSVTDNGGDGSLSYDNSTGVISYTGPSAAEVQAHISAVAADFVDYSAGSISINASEFSASFGLALDNDASGVQQHISAVAADFVDYSAGSISINASEFSASFGLALDADAAGVRQHISVTDNGGDGSLSYDQATGVISFTGPSAAEVRAHLSNGGGLDFAAGEFSVLTDGTTIQVNGSSKLEVVDGGISNAKLAGSIENEKLSNSTISGVSLGSDLNSLSAGTGITMTAYNGSAAVNDLAVDQGFAPTWTGVHKFDEPLQLKDQTDGTYFKLSVNDGFLKVVEVS